MGLKISGWGNCCVSAEHFDPSAHRTIKEKGLETTYHLGAFSSLSKHYIHPIIVKGKVEGSLSPP